MIAKRSGHRVERRKSSGRIPSGPISEELQQKLKDVMGLERNQIFNRRGWLSELGVVALLDMGDEIVDVQETHLVIRTAEGERQTVYNLDKDLPFFKRIKE